MHLRHKKPLNPYKGQANNDKNEEFNDDDFRQQASPLKKTPNPANEQISKYAKLLAKFVKTTNQDYRLYRLRNHLEDIPLPPPRQYQPIIEELDLPPNNSALKSQQIKYQKQVPKLQTKREGKEESKTTKNSHKKKEPSFTAPPPRQNKNKFAEGTPQNAIDLTKNTTMQRNPHEINGKNSQAQLKPVKNDPPPPTTFPPKVNTNPGFNFQGPMSIPPQLNALGLNGNLQGYMGLQGLFNPNQMGMDMYASLNQMQLEQLRHMGMRFNPLENLMPAYMSNIGNMGMFINNSMSLRPNLKPHHNLFVQQVKSLHLPSQPSSTNPQPPLEVYPLKRGAFHAGIAYKIYLDKLKKAGTSFDNLEEIDPTRNARRVKSGQTQAKSRQPLKKKK